MYLKLLPKSVDLLVPRHTIFEQSLSGSASGVKNTILFFFIYQWYMQACIKQFTTLINNWLPFKLVSKYENCQADY